MATSDNKVEIKLITDYREYLLSKIEFLKGSLTQVASSFGNELTSSIDEFSRKINGKLKIIDERFAKNSEELEAVRAELLSKKFDESNFNNVSMIRTLDKTIKERDLKIKELESRIRYLETNSSANGNNNIGNSSNANSNANANVVGVGNDNGKIKKETEKPIKQNEETIVNVISEAVDDAESDITQEKKETFKDAPRVKDADGDIVIAISAKKSRFKTDKKKTSEQATIQQSDESSSAGNEIIVEEKAKKPIRKIKKASKIEREEESNVVLIPESIPVSEQINCKDVDDYNDAMEAQRLADEEALRLAQEEAEEAERIAEEQRMADEEAAEAKRVAEEKRLEEERIAKEAASGAEAEKKKKTEVVKKQLISKKDNKDSSKESSTFKKITAKTVSAPLPTPTSVSKVESATKTISTTIKPKETTKVKLDYPDKLPDLEDLDVITVNDNDYYCDKNNQGVYQMINGDDIGIFLGYYNPETEKITPIDAD